MKLGYTIIYVKNVLETINFYQDAFSLKLKFVHESNEYAELETGNTVLAFVSETLGNTHGFAFKPNRPDETPAGFEIAFVTEDVQKSFQTALAAGAKELAAPQKKPWGQTVAYVSDLNGVLVEICSPVKP